MGVYKRGSVYHYDFIVDGRRYCGSTKQTKEKPAERVEETIRAQVLTGNFDDKPKRKKTLQDIYPRFKQFIEEARSPKSGLPLDSDTKRYYLNGWRLLKEKDIVHMRIANISQDDIGLLNFAGGPSNTNNALRTLRRMLHKAKDWGYISDIPKIVMAQENGRDRTFNRLEEETFLKVAKQPCRDVALAVFDTGMRPESVYAMRWEHIRWHDREIFVPKSKSPSGRRGVPLSIRLCSALQARWHSQGEPKEGWVFPCRLTKKGKPANGRKSSTGHIANVAKQYVAARKAAGLPADLVLYSHRHTFGTRLYSKTGNLKVVMDVMGHDRIDTTMRYQHPEVDVARAAVDEWNAEESPAKSTQSGFTRVM